ncbi:MAG: type II secretion system minor pseudopilin GspK [Deltaproteobacteria bacterium]|nr:type II secretion system minor pseudopilin GspK [Deltaproteobacteria bacterium]
MEKTRFVKSVCSFYPATRAKQEQGLALVITLLITAILVAVIVEIVYAVHIHISMTNSYRDAQRASLLAEGGVEFAGMGLDAIMKNMSYTALNEENSYKVFAEGNKALVVKAEDEHGKVSLNAIVYSNGETNTEYYNIYSRLLENLGLGKELSDTTADWIDINDEIRPGGGETYNYYQRLSSAYAAKNSPMDSIEELLLIKGYSATTYKRLTPFVTTYTDGSININTAPKEVIMSMHDDITEDMAQRVLDYRRENPFKDTADIRKVAGFETIGFSLQGKIVVKSNIFRIFSKADVGGTLREVEAVVQTGQAHKILFWRER